METLYFIYNYLGIIWLGIVLFDLFLEARALHYVLIFIADDEWQKQTKSYLLKRNAEKSDSGHASTPAPMSPEKLNQLQVDIEKLVQTRNSLAVDRIVEVMKEYEPDKAESCNFAFEDLKPTTLQYLAHIVYLSKNGLKYSLATPIKYYNTRTIFSYMKPQSYEIKSPPQASLDGWSSLLKKLRQVGCYYVEKFRLVTINSCALNDGCLLFTNPNFATS